MKISADGNTIVIRIPDNWHVHFRQEKLMEFLVGIFLKYGWRGRLVAEPNTLPAILTGEAAVAYGRQIVEAAIKYPYGKLLTPVLTIQITESTTPEMIYAAHALGIRICKVYPRYVTTNSENGVVDYRKIYPALRVYQELGMIVQFHAEHPSYKVIGRLKEQSFIPILDDIRREFPKLKISVEHVSSKEMVSWVKSQQSLLVGAGVTVQHMYDTSDDILGYSERSKGRVNSIHACKPCPKDPDDRDVIGNTILSGDPQFWYAGDDAAHLKKDKCSGYAPCGNWNTIAALSKVVSFFKKNGKIEKVEPFLSEFGARFYGYELNADTLTLTRDDWNIEPEYEVPGLNDSIIPSYANEAMEWKLAA